MEECIPFTIRMDEMTTVDQLGRCGFHCIGNNVLNCHTMINKYLSACITITSSIPIKRVLAPKHCVITLEVLDEMYLQPYNPAWSEIKRVQCKSDLMHALCLPETMHIEEQDGNGSKKNITETMAALSCFLENQDQLNRKDFFSVFEECHITVLRYFDG